MPASNGQVASGVNPSVLFDGPTLDDEWRRLAREFHDLVGQPLTALLLRLRSALDKPALARADIQPLEEIAAEALTAARALAYRLRHESNLGDRLENARVYARPVLAAVGCRLSWVDARDAALIPEQVVTEVAQIIREAVTNAAKHARARLVRVAIAVEGGVLRADVSDDGDGFDVIGDSLALATTGLGLLSCQERAALIGGTFTVQSHPTVGTTVHVEVPVGFRVTPIAS